MAQALRQGNHPDVTYAAAVAAAKAAMSTARSQLPTVVFPVIVTDARLFNCSLSDDDPTAIDLQEVTAGDLLWRNPIAQRRYTIIRVTNIDQLERFAAVAYRSAMKLVDKTSSELQSLSSSRIQETELLKEIRGP
jgi:hypothetical protein